MEYLYNFTREPQKNFIWESSIPDSLKKLNSHSARPESDCFFSKKHRKRSSIFAKKPSKPRYIPIEEETQNEFPSYSIKYLGVTNGQIGILSRRAPIPQLSPFETCKDVALAMINTSVPENTNTRSLSAISTSKKFSRQTGVSVKNYKDLLKNSDEDYVIHTYARPRGFVALRRSTKERLVQSPNPSSVKKIQSGISGWKLIRPKTTSAQRFLKKQPDEKSLFVKSKHIHISKAYGEPYIKFLANSKKPSVLK